MTKLVQEQYYDEAVALLEKNGYSVGEYNPHRVSAWLIQNSHVVALGIGSCEQEAIDYVVDNGLWDSLKMSAEDFQEYDSQNWHDSFITAGNASEPFWAEQCHAIKILTP